MDKVKRSVGSPGHSPFRLVNTAGWAKLWVITLVAGMAIACRPNLPTDSPPSSSTQLSAQAQQPPSTDCKIIHHQQGKTELCGQPQNIVALGSAMLEILLALEIQPAGYSDPFSTYQGDYSNPAQTIPILGDRVTSQPVNIGSSFTPSLEALLTAKPDLILTTEYSELEYQTLADIAPTLQLKWFDAAQNIQTIANVVGRTEEADVLLTQTQQSIDQARKKFTPFVKAHPKILALGTFGLPDFYLMTESNGFCGTLISDLGFQLIYPPDVDATDESIAPPISIELLPQLDEANGIVLFGHEMNQWGEEQALDALKQYWDKNAIAQSLRASKSGRVYFVPAYLCLGLPGPIGTELYLAELQQQLYTVNSE